MTTKLGFSDGAKLFAEGARIIRHRSLARYVWLPALVSLVIIGTGLVVAFGYIGDLSDYLTDKLPSWLGFLNWILIPLVYVFGALLGAWLTGFLAVLIASPFLGELSIAIEKLRYDTAPEHDPTVLAMIRSALGREVRKLSYHLPRLLLVFIVTLIPVVNTVSPAIWFLFGAWLMAVQFADFPGENRGRPFDETLAMLKANRRAAFGYGSCATLAISIPFANFLLIPVAVAGGTLLWHALLEDDAKRGDDAKREDAAKREDVARRGDAATRGDDAL